MHLLRITLLCGSLAPLLIACNQPGPPVPAESTPPQAAPSSGPAPQPLPEEVPPDEPAGKRTVDRDAPPLLAYRVVGTEPFWGIRVEGDALHFTTLDDQTGKRLAGTHSLLADGIRYVGNDNGSAFELELRSGECSDGMSDTVYAFKANFRYGETTYTGCAQAAKAE